MSLVLSLAALAGSILWELVEARTDFLAHKTVRVAARKSLIFWFVVLIIGLILGGFWGYLLGGSKDPSEPFFDLSRPVNGLVLTALFSGFGSMPALKGFKLLPIVNKVVGKVSFDDISVRTSKGLPGAIKLWWSL